MYFANFPLIVYDSVGNGNFKIVTNLLKRVAMRTKVRTNTLLYDTYDVKEGETPEMIADKYSNIDAVHHYEVSQTSGDTSIKINIGTDTTGYSEADLTTVTNREFEEERQDKLRQIRLLDRAYIEQFVEEFETLMGESVL